MSKTYGVKVPFAGYVYTEVDAANEAEAEEKGYDKACEEINSADKLWNAIEEWDFHKAIVKGNILYPSQNEVEADLVWEKENEEK
jgi:hypothetical protein